MAVAPKLGPLAIEMRADPADLQAVLQFIADAVGDSRARADIAHAFVFSEGWRFRPEMVDCVQMPIRKDVIKISQRATDKLCEFARALAAGELDR